MQEIRSKAYAGFELVLDLMHELRAGFKMDAESLLIMCCVNEAVMRPLVLDPKTPASVKAMPAPPEQYRGSISMLLVAERVGLPRETVRRKIKALIRGGWLFEDEEGRIRATPRLAEPASQRMVRESFAAVKRYDERLRQLGFAGVCSSPSKSQGNGRRDP
jgi:hypothetical protein